MDVSPLGAVIITKLKGLLMVNRVNVAVLKPDNSHNTTFSIPLQQEMLHFRHFLIASLSSLPSSVLLLISFSPVMLCGSVGSAAGRRVGCSAAASAGSHRVSGCRRAETDVCSSPTNKHVAPV